jgi:hypothetical protein
MANAEYIFASAIVLRMNYSTCSHSNRLFINKASLFQYFKQTHFVIIKQYYICIQLEHLCELTESILKWIISNFLKELT